MRNNRKPPSALERLQSFVDGLWDGSSIRLGADLSRVEKFAHFWVLVFRSFARNRCPVHAYALSYTTLLAMVPMLAVVLSLTSSLLKNESEERIGQFIDRLVMTLVPAGTEAPEAATTTPDPPTETEGENGTSGVAASTNTVSGANLAPLPATNTPADLGASLAQLAQKPEIVDARKRAARWIHQFIQNAWSGTMGTVGTGLLLYIAIAMLARIEDTFNDIWGVARGRTWFMRIVLYWAVISLAPLLLISALTLASGRHLSGTREFIAQTPFVGQLVFSLTPIVVLWLTFSAFYKLVPNTRIDWTAALAGGGVCAILWHLNNTLSVYYVSRVVTNSKIYGSLGLLPVFMIGLYFSWFFLLLGAQFAYAWQNRAAYLQEKLAERVDQRGREFVALRLMTGVGQYFQAGEAAASVSELSATLGVPTRLTQQILQTLKAAQLVAEVAGKEVAYLPARPLETITCHDILQAMRATSNQPLPRRDEPATNEVLGEFERIQAAERQAATAVTLAALVARAQARLQLAAPLAVEAQPKAANLPPAPAAGTVSSREVPRSGEHGDRPNSAPTAAMEIKDAPLAEPSPPAPVRDSAAPGLGSPPSQPSAQEFVSIKLPTTTQPTEDEERTFPL